MRKTIKLTVGILSFLLLVFISIFLLNDNLSIHDWVKTDKTVDSELLIIEGWLNPNHFNTILSEYNSKKYKKILITGSPIPESVSLFVNGQIIIKNAIQDSISLKYKHMCFTLNGTKAFDKYSKCEIYKNDSLLTTGVLRGDSTIHIYSNLINTDSLVVEFINDAYQGKDDRNLILKKLLIDSKPINLRTKNVWLNYKNIYHTNDFTSDSERSLTELQKMGINKQDINFIYTKTRGLSKTYNFASEAVKWMKNNNYSTANIITLSYHSKRTLLSFNKACPNFEFGIQSILFYPSRLRLLKELAGNAIIKLSPKFVLDLKLKTI